MKVWENVLVVKRECLFFWCLDLCLNLFCVVTRAKRTGGMSTTHDTRAVIAYKFNHILLTPDTCLVLCASHYRCSNVFLPLSASYGSIQYRWEQRVPPSFPPHRFSPAMPPFLPHRSSPPLPRRLPAALAPLRWLPSAKAETKSVSSLRAEMKSKTRRHARRPRPPPFYGFPPISQVGGKISPTQVPTRGKTV
jgi:hypothetical protein